jgi:predicted glycogen debranching enzyme
MPLEEAMKAAISNYIVRRDNHKTVIAGYPWFLDWGRDTLIFLRGVAAAGRWDEVFDALTEFGRFEKGGMIPNMIRGEDDANRETVDAPLWFAVICDDAIAHFGADRVLSHPCGKRTLKDILVSIAENYVKGTENGIRVDPETGLVWAPHHYTWMDTNYPAGTPRNGYSVEIQALWVRLLDLLGREVAPKWKRLASRARRSFCELFPLPDGNGLSDCLYAEAGVSARCAEQDDAIRPNQLYAITLGLLKRDKSLARSVLRATACLLTPGAIRTLAHAPVKRPLSIKRDGRLLNDPHNPYWGRYEGDEDTRRKPAYHNGTAWTFPFPLYPEAFFMVEGEATRELAQMILSSGSFLANIDCVTQMPECSQGNAPHEPCGTGAQA